MNSLGLWLLFAGAAAGTFALRFSFIYFFGKFDVPEVLQRALRFVPASVLAALVLPALVYPNGTFDISLHNIYLLAGIGGGLVAWKTKDVLWTIIVGMLLFWFFSWLL